MHISISEGIEFFHSVPVESVAALGELATKSNISTSVFREGKRNIASFERADVIGLDIDNDNKKGTPVLSVAEAKKIFSSYKFILLSTRNHNEEKNGIVAERFRIILFLETPIVTANDFYATWHWLKDQFPWIDPQCKDPSRFWYQHKGVLASNEEGALIPAIRYTEPEKPQREGRPVLPGERGELGKSTLQFLEFGVEAGSRNGTVYKVARDFQQSLYEYEEAESRILAALERNDVTSSDFPESEARMAIRSAYSKDAKHAPRIVDAPKRSFSYQSIGELVNSPDAQEDWLVKDLFIRGGVSLIVGAPKIGKSTIVRQLERCVLRGNPFLKKATQKGSVFHYSFDEKPRTAKVHYMKLGLGVDDPLSLHFGAATGSNYMKDFQEDILKYKPALVVVDTMFDILDVEDVNSYAPIKRALSVFNTLAERSNSHILFVHHVNKPSLNNSTGNMNRVLGSQAIFGAVDCAVLFEVFDKNPTKRTMKVEGRGIDDTKLHLKFDRERGTYSVDDYPIGDEF